MIQPIVTYSVIDEVSSTGKRDIIITRYDDGKMTDRMFLNSLEAWQIGRSLIDKSLPLLSRSETR